MISAYWAPNIGVKSRSLLGTKTLAPTMKQWLLYSLPFLCALSGFSQEQFDSTFATDGVFILDASPDFDDYFFDIMVLPDQKMVAVGYVVSESGQSDMLVVKLEENGTLDLSFGENGMVILDINTWDQAFTVVPYSDGKILIGGRSGAMSSSTQSCVVMLQADGSIDEDFGTNGVFQTALGIGSSSANVVLIDGDNHILVGGNSNFDIHVYKLSPTGEPVPAYGMNGLSTTAFVYPLSCTDMALQPNGELVLGGKANPFTDDIVVVRLLEDGSLDEDFGDDGFFFYDFDLSIYGSDESVESIVLDESGRIWLGGQTRYFDESDSHFYVMALDEEGNLDVNFGEDGVYRYPTIGFSFGNDLLISEEQEILLAGGFLGSGSDGSDLSLLKLDTEGSIDTSYGNNGLQLFGLSEGSIDRIFSIKPQSEDKWLVAGFYRPSGVNFASFIARIGNEAEDPISSTQDLALAPSTISPNPVGRQQNAIVISLGEIPLQRWQLFDTNGRLVHAQAPGGAIPSRELTIDISFLEPGVYFLQLETEEGQRTEKLVVE